MKTTLDKCCSVTPQRQIIKAENTVKSTVDTQVRLRKINHKKFFKKLLTVCKNHILLEKLLFFLLFSQIPSSAPSASPTAAPCNKDI